MHLSTVRPRSFPALAAMAALILALLGSAASAETYAPAPSKATVSGTPTAGGTLTISGYTDPFAPVTVTLDEQSSADLNAAALRVLGTTIADAEGAYSLSVTLPTGLSAGSYVMVVESNGRILSTMAVAGETPTAAPAPSAGGSPDVVGDTSPRPAPASARGGLPVTGATTGLLIMLGVALVGVGGSIIALSKSRQQTIAA